MLQKVKDMYRLQKEAKRAKKELRTFHIEAEHKGVTVVVDGEQTVVSIVIAPDVPREFIPEYTKEALNRALKKAQIIAAEKMQGVMGELGIGQAGS
ncbi:MAG: YbaB/EbfC family nucleoid-associated protein [Patescibacteria group bacterium]